MVLVERIVYFRHLIKHLMSNNFYRKIIIFNRKSNNSQIEKFFQLNEIRHGVLEANSELVKEAYFSPEKSTTPRAPGIFSNYFSPSGANRSAQEISSAKLVAKAASNALVPPPPTCSVASANVAAALQVFLIII